MATANVRGLLRVQRMQQADAIATGFGQYLPCCSICHSR
jgi:hypothetical protein